MKKRIFLILIIIMICFITPVFAQPGETKEMHYYKAIVPFRTGDLQAINAYDYIGVEIKDNCTIHLDLAFDGDDRDWFAKASIGAIEKTGDERYRDVVCVFKQNFMKEKFGPHIIGTTGLRWDYKYYISCNHTVSLFTALVDEDYCDFEEITEEEYYEYIPRNGIKKQENNNEDLYLYENNNQLTGWQKDSDGTRYFDPNTGKAVYGWKKIDGKWYYFMPGDCYMVRNKTIDGYYLNNKGVCKDYDTGNIEDIETEEEITVHEGWYLEPIGWKYYSNGSPISGWAKIDNSWYYFTPENYVMQVNTTIDGYVKRWEMDRE